jgi:hypothetical protein
MKNIYQLTVFHRALFILGVIGASVVFFGTAILTIL